jgi:hypothetical protein
MKMGQIPNPANPEPEYTCLSMQSLVLKYRMHEQVADKAIAELERRLGPLEEKSKASIRKMVSDMGLRMATDRKAFDRLQTLKREIEKELRSRNIDTQQFLTNDMIIEANNGRNPE